MTDLNRQKVKTGLVATGTDYKTALQLPTDYDVYFVSTVAAGTGVAVVQQLSGNEIVITNNGANALLVYPVTGNKFTGNGVNVPISVAAGNSLTLITADGVEWNPITDVTGSAPAPSVGPNLVLGTNGASTIVGIGGYGSTGGVANQVMLTDGSGNLNVSALNASGTVTANALTVTNGVNVTSGAVTANTGGFSSSGTSTLATINSTQGNFTNVSAQSGYINGLVTATFGTTNLQGTVSINAATQVAISPSASVIGSFDCNNLNCTNKVVCGSLNVGVSTPNTLLKTDASYNVSATPYTIGTTTGTNKVIATDSSGVLNTGAISSTGAISTTNNITAVNGTFSGSVVTAGATTTTGTTYTGQLVTTGKQSIVQTASTTTINTNGSWAGTVQLTGFSLAANSFIQYLFNNALISTSTIPMFSVITSNSSAGGNLLPRVQYIGAGGYSVTLINQGTAYSNETVTIAYTLL
jgi:cytoskeletal protein CcmA (bactofilin family)